MKRDIEVEKRFRQALERLHRAQLESLGRPGPGFGDAYEAVAGLLECVGVIGSLLATLAWEEKDVAGTRRQLVCAVVEAGTRVAEVLGLALDVGARPGEWVLSECDEVGEPPAIRSPRTEGGDLRSVTDLNRLMQKQLLELFGARRQEPEWSIRSAELLWRDLLGHVAGILPVAAVLDRRDVTGEERRILEEGTARAANCLGLLRSYPRRPAV